MSAILKKLLKKTFLLTEGIALLLSVVFLIQGCDFTEGQFQRKIATLKKNSQPIIVYLNKYHSEHGKYPTVLPKKYQNILDCASPKGKYSLENFPKGTINFKIQFGEYHENNFELFWHSADNRWMLDR